MTDTTPTTTTISPLRQRLLEDMAARRLGRHSQRSHLHSCLRFAAFLGRSPETATPDDVRLFQLHLIQSGLKIPNRNRIMTGVRFLFRVTLRRLDLVSEVYHMSEPYKVPLILSQDEMRRLLAMAGCLRDRLLLSLGYGAGLRAGEVVRLRVKHIDSGQKIIRVEQAKGQKDRLVMLSPETLAMMREWWPQRPTRWDALVGPQDRLLFPGRKPGEPLTTRQLSRLFHETADAAGLKKAVNLHSLRHSFATHLFDRGVDIRTIQALLGHSKLETTARYAQVATGLISGVVSPLDDLSAAHAKREKRGKD